MPSTTIGVRNLLSRSARHFATTSIAAVRGRKYRLSIVTFSLASAAVFGLAFYGTPAAAAEIAFYPLDGNLNDASGNGNTGTGALGLTYAPGGGIISDGVSTNEYFTSPVNPNNYNQITFVHWSRQKPADINYPSSKSSHRPGGFHQTAKLDIYRGSGNGPVFAFTVNGAVGDRFGQGRSAI